MKTTPNSSSYSDEKLLYNLASGDHYSFTLIYERYHKLLYSVAMTYLMDRSWAEDVVQNVFIRLWEYRQKIQVNISLRNFLFTMTKNHILNEIRNKNTALTKNYELAQTQSSYEEDLLEKIEEFEMMKLLYEAIEKLPEKKRKVCLLKLIKRLSNQEIAEEMNVSVNTVKTHYLQALHTLRTNLRQSHLVLLILLLP